VLSNCWKIVQVTKLSDGSMLLWDILVSGLCLLFCVERRRYLLKEDLFPSSGRTVGTQLLSWVQQSELFVDGSWPFHLRMGQTQFLKICANFWIWCGWIDQKQSKVIHCQHGFAHWVLSRCCCKQCNICWAGLPHTQKNLNTFKQREALYFKEDSNS